MHKKLDAKSEKCIFIGYHNDSKAYNVGAWISDEAVLIVKVETDSQMLYLYYKEEDKTKFLLICHKAHTQNTETMLNLK